MQAQPVKPEVRVTQRAPQRCLECSRRRVRCSKDLPCDTCIRRGTAHLCRRETVIVQGRVTNADESKESEDGDTESSDASAATHRVRRLAQENRRLKLALRQYHTKFGSLDETAERGAESTSPPSPPQSDDSNSPLSRIPSQQSRCANDSLLMSSHPSPFGTTTDPSFLALEPDRLIHRTSTSSTSSGSSGLSGLTATLPGYNTSPQEFPDTYPSDPTSINGFVRLGRTLPASFTPFAELLDDHVSIVAVTEGWDAIERQIDLDPQWKILKMIDQAHLVKYRPGDRLAAVRLFRIATKYYAAPDRHDPIVESFMLNYLKPLPCQISIAHPHVINYVAWPNFRERLVFNQDQYYNHEFYDVFMQATRFRWEDSIHATYFRNPSTSMLQLKNDFVTRLEDINSWTMTHDFFDQYPDFEGDAPRYEEGPSGVRPSQRLLLRAMLEESMVSKPKRKRVKKAVVREVEGQLCKRERAKE